MKLTNTENDYCDHNYGYKDSSLQHIGYKFRYFNDCHIHLGESPEVNRGLSYHDILDYKHTFSIGHVLVLDKNLPRLAYFLNREIYGLHGLQWISEHDTADSILTYNKNIIGCKFHGAYENHPKPNAGVLEELNKFGAILMMHTGRFKDGNIASKTSYLHSIEIAKEYPYIKLIMAHMGGTDTNICKAAIDASVYCRNVYFDTSGITTPYIIEYAVSQIGSERIMFGSDAPWCSWRAQYCTVLDAQIAHKDMENVLRYNFERLLK